ncbi:hypothetical protein GUJ93_ZPchr0014g47467 [Zizania palustris]|uniref:Uncharacterized protein n=1 Tax=Zizania palustris TaxID=103762 RepID=A0A8J5VRR6_ZIZPA|nr:hypothetical protein GUJ93_ZPchr0014g47467 [Zizania palustris]
MGPRSNSGAAVFFRSRAVALRLPHARWPAPPTNRTSVALVRHGSPKNGGRASQARGRQAPHPRPRERKAVRSTVPRTSRKPARQQHSTNTVPCKRSCVETQRATRSAPLQKSKRPKSLPLFLTPRLVVPSRLDPGPSTSPWPAMASDSDVDEDELLQMALQEQAARDLSHQRPSGAGKPVVNLVRPPAPSSRAGANGRGGGGPAKAPQPSRGGDDDDDSEVELLSISSGDEDSGPSRDRGPPPPRGGGRARARRAASRDDGDFDDDEPRSWKRVDEAEVWIGEISISGPPPHASLGRFGIVHFDDPGKYMMDFFR